MIFGGIVGDMVMSKNGNALVVMEKNGFLPTLTIIAFTWQNVELDTIVHLSG
jgi:hypothetical protein